MKKKSEIELSYFHSISQVGLNKNGTNKINQEALLEIINVLGNTKFNIFGIFGGHGTNGHIISRYISRYIKEYFLFSENKLVLKNCKTNKELYDLFSKNNYSYIKQLMYECQYSLQNSQIDCDYSGSTCLIIFIIEKHLICSNIGNCRAIILEKKDLFQITFDQTLDIPEERRRIESKGGNIIWSVDSSEEYQIILKDKDFKSHYIEISRSLGDKKFKEIGVDFAPVITEYMLNIETKFIIMATKGLWKVLTNKQAAYYVNKGYKVSNPLESCRKIMEKASDIYVIPSNFGWDDIGTWRSIERYIAQVPNKFRI
jgi:serine/threonine protein phosphatase PrpC